MDREPLLLLLFLAGVVPSALLGPLFPAAAPSFADGRAWEQASWRLLWLPLLPMAAWVALLGGWALEEPDAAEAPHGLVLVMAIVGGGVVARALGRALWTAWRPVSAHAATVGLVRPRVVVSGRLRLALEPAALRAAMAHEAAHARHRDPLRLWLAQLATDLQLPSGRAMARLDEWRHALECARDDEARHQGSDGADLARAILVTARLQTSPSPAIGLIGDGERLRTRVHRLLVPPPPTHDRGRASWWLLGLILPVATGFWLGETLIGGLLR